MNLLRVIFTLGVLAIVHLRAPISPAAVVDDRQEFIGAGERRLAEEDIVDVGVVQVHAIAHEDQQAGENLVEKLEAYGETTGEIPCTPRPCTVEQHISGARSLLLPTAVRVGIKIKSEPPG